MRTKPGTVRLIALALALMGLTAACGGAGSGSGEKAIVIGMVEDSTGPAAPYATVAGATVRDAIDQINDNGGLLGRQVKLVVGNDESDPTKAPSVARRLISKGAVALVMNSGSQSAVQVKPVVKQAKVPMIAPTNLTNTIATPPDNEYSYILANSVADIATVYSRALPKADVRRLAIFADDSAAIAGINELLLPKLKKSGIRIVAQEKASTSASDVSAQVARIKAARPDAVLVTSLGGQLEILFNNTAVKQLPDIPVFSLASIGNQPNTWRQANPGALQGMVYISSLTDENPQTQQLKAFLKKRRGAEFSYLTAYDAQAYDAVRLFAKAIKRAGKADGTVDGETINAELQQIEGYPASFGQPGFTLSFSENKHIGTDGLCGLLLRTFGKENRPAQPWDVYQPNCN